MEHAADRCSNSFTSSWGTLQWVALAALPLAHQPWRSAATRGTKCFARCSKQPHPFLRGERCTWVTNHPGSKASGSSTLKQANSFVGFSSNCWLAGHRSVGLLLPKESLIARSQCDCSGELDLPAQVPFWSGGSKLLVKTLWSFRSGNGTGATGLLPLKERSHWQHTLPAADLPIKQITKCCPWHKQTPLLCIQSSAQTELSRTLQNKFESNINVHLREKEEGKKKHLCATLSLK